MLLLKIGRSADWRPIATPAFWTAANRLCACRGGRSAGCRRYPSSTPTDSPAISLPAVKLTWLHIGENRTEVLGGVLGLSGRATAGFSRPSRVRRSTFEAAGGRRSSFDARRHRRAAGAVRPRYGRPPGGRRNQRAEGDRRPCRSRRRHSRSWPSRHGGHARADRIRPGQARCAGRRRLRIRGCPRRPRGASERRARLRAEIGGAAHAPVGDPARPRRRALCSSAAPQRSAAGGFRVARRSGSAARGADRSADRGAAAAEPGPAEQDHRPRARPLRKKRSRRISPRSSGP